MSLNRWGSDLLRDLQYGTRVMRRSPLFAVVAIGSLALGIGGAASVFTVLNAVVLRTLPVPSPHQIYAVEKRLANQVSPRYSWPSFQEAQREVGGNAELAAYTDSVGLQLRRGAASSAQAERGMVQLVSGEYFEVLRQRAQAGRLIGRDDNRTLAGHPVAVISDTYWLRHFSRGASAIGSELVINGATFTIIGVARPEFFGTVVALRNPDAWIPLVMQPTVRYAFNASNDSTSDPRQPWPPQAGIEWLKVIARSPDTARADAAAAALTVLHQRSATATLDAADEEGRRRVERERVALVSAAQGVSFLRDDLQTPLLVLLAMVGVLLAIACGNVASLLLARASARDREIAIRLSIGAGRWRVVRQLLSETLLLAIIGGGLGLVIAAWGRDLLLAMFSRGASVIDLDTRFDWRVMAFSIGVTLATGIAAGLVPAFRGTRVGLAEAMNAQARTVGAAGGRRGARLGKVLVAAQIAFCLLLLVVAGLFMRSMQSLLGIDVGYDRARVLVARLDVRSLGLEPARRQALYDRVVARVSAIPGVEGASVSMNGPLGTSQRTSSLAVEGYTSAPGENLVTNEEVVTDRYFETVGLALRDGRLFATQDRKRDGTSTIINATMARRFFPNGDAIGRRWTYGDPIADGAPTIVGIVEDAKYVDLRGAPPNMIYHLAAARPDDVLNNLEVRTSMGPAALANAVRQAVAEVEPALPVFDIVPLEERLNRGVSYDRLVASLTAAFGATALLLACLGLYGTISYGVARRVTELGVRMALGARRSSVLWLVIREALVLVGIGGLIGIPLALVASRSISSMLYGVRAADPIAYAAGFVLMFVVAAAAACLPAWRASRIDPMAALRS